MPSLSVIALWLYCAFVGYTSFVIFKWVETRRLTHPSYPEVSEFGLAAIYSVVLVIAHKIFQRVMLPVAQMVIVKKDKWSREVHESKLTRFGSAVFKFLFFLGFSTYSFMFALADAPWMPPELWGKGSTMQAWGKGNAGDTQEEMSASLKLFYQVALAYHLSELIFQVVFEREKPDFLEMFLHHITTCFLVFASFLANFVRIGSLVLFVHYASDVPIYSAKIFVDTSCKITTFLCLLAMLASWGYLRLYVFPMHIIRSTLLECGLERNTLGDLAYYTFNVALSSLLCLHAYWYCLFLKMGYSHVFKGETRDMQANLTRMDLKKGPQTLKKE